VRPRCVPPKHKSPPCCFWEERGCCDHRRSSLRRAWRSCTPSLCAMALSGARAVRRRRVPQKSESPRIVFGRDVGAATASRHCAARRAHGHPARSPSALRRPSGSCAHPRPESRFSFLEGTLLLRPQAWPTALHGALGRPTCAPWRPCATEWYACTALLRKTNKGPPCCFWEERGCGDHRWSPLRWTWRPSLRNLFAVANFGP
jgi:hypothetical protein